MDKGIKSILVFLFILVWVSTAFAQIDVPVMSASLPEDFQIAFWDGEQFGEWMQIIPTLVQFDNYPIVDEHNPFSVLPQTTWNADTSGVYPGCPSRILFELDISDVIPDNVIHCLLLFNIRYRVRVTVFGNELTSEWSEPNFLWNLISWEYLHKANNFIPTE